MWPTNTSLLQQQCYKSGRSVSALVAGDRDPEGLSVFICVLLCTAGGMLLPAPWQAVVDSSLSTMSRCLCASFFVHDLAC